MAIAPAIRLPAMPDVRKEGAGCDAGSRGGIGGKQKGKGDDVNLQCLRCKNDFESDCVLAYCDDCKSAFDRNREGIHDKQRPLPGVFADGKFADENTCPVSVIHPVTEQSVCGMCGSGELEPGYGVGSGFGFGAYSFCCGCNRFLDFREDCGE